MEPQARLAVGKAVRLEIVRAALGWLALSAVGAAVVALPDAGPAVVTVSRTHGPGPVDLVGVGLALLGWLVFVVALWRARASVTTPYLPVAAAVVLGGVVVAWSVLTDAGSWWVLGVAVLVGAQLSMAVSAATAQAARQVGAGPGRQVR